MAKAASAQIAVSAYGDGVGLSVTLNLTNAASPAMRQELVLANGVNTAITAPTGAVAMVIESISAGTLVAKGANGDTGVSVKAGTVIPPPAVLNSAGGATVTVFWI